MEFKEIIKRYHNYIKLYDVEVFSIHETKVHFYALCYPSRLKEMTEEFNRFWDIKSQYERIFRPNPVYL